VRTMRHLSRALSIAGGLLVLVGLALGIGVGAPLARAQVLPPRPTDVPRPTSVASTPAPNPNQGSPGAAAPTGRITGTVIDLTTGAPAPGISVVVGERAAITDANGNYDFTGLASGNYRVALALAEGQGTPAQDPVTVVLAADATVVQHLFFRSQPAASPAPAPTASILPAELPRTAGLEPGGGLWVLLGIGMIVLGGAISAARQRQV
jgi:Carboxypeptidase regulatory-like domain